MYFKSPIQYLTNAWLLTCENIKAKPCRHCSRTGYIKSHGRLQGIGVDSPKRTIRGLRFFCSNRYSNKGCGRSFSVFLSTVIANHSLNTKYLLAFIKHFLNSPNTHAAWHSSSIPFSLCSTYRWVKKLSLNQSTIRHMLHRNTPPPNTAKDNPLHTTLTYLLKAFPKKNDPLSCFQHHHDTGIFHYNYCHKPS